MSKGLVLEFTKMHGAGNDFIVVDNRFFRLSTAELSRVAARFCPRRVGIGADGLLALAVAKSDDIDYRMEYFNADGSLSDMCGNGARCLASFAAQAGIDTDPLIFETAAGIYKAHVTPGDPDYVKLILPAARVVDLDYGSVEVDPGRSLDFAFIVAGVPHAVCFGDGNGSIDEIPVQKWGSLVRYNERFDETSGTNVDFTEVVERNGDSVLKVRTYERGVEAETFACGTGAVSAMVAAVESGRISQRECTVEMLGGPLRVGYVDGSDELYLEGPAVHSYRGSIVV